ncbi:hypothetical protein AAVH_08104 [Aphelenchoides avenae]|nr:hypothetical protein AAVH_08104 [Aphelenchus avenae]
MSMLRHKAGWTVRGSGEFTSSDDDSDSDAPEASTPKRATLATKNPIPACSTAATAQAVVPESNATQEDVAPTSTGNEAGHYATDSVHSFGAYLCYAYIELCKELDETGRRDVAARMRQQLCALLGGYHSAAGRPAEHVVLLTVDEARPTHQPVTPESSSNDEASLHAIAQSTIKQLKAKADGHEEENGRLKERLRKYEETFVLQSNQLMEGEKHLERLEKDFSGTLAQLRFCKLTAEREKQARTAAEARLAKQVAENDAMKLKLAHIESVYGRILQQFEFEAANRENRDKNARNSNDTSPTVSEDSGLQQTDTSQATQCGQDEQSPLTIDEDNCAEAGRVLVQNDSSSLRATSIPALASVLPSVRGNAIIKLDIPNFRPFAYSGGLSTSAYTHICGVPWRVLATCQPQSGLLRLGVFVQALYRDHDQRHNVVASLRLVSQKRTVADVTKRISATFCNARKDWGYVSFARVEDVLNPANCYMFNGIVKLAADIYAEEFS